MPEAWLDELVSPEWVVPKCPFDLVEVTLKTHNLFADSTAMVWDLNKPMVSWGSIKGSIGMRPARAATWSSQSNEQETLW